MSPPFDTQQRTECEDGILSSANRRAPLSLHFIIVGGDIGGLSCAYALASAGHKVRVLERLRKDDPTSWCGIRVPPNLSKILSEWGLGEEMKEKMLPCHQVMWNDLDTGDVIGCIKWKQEVIRETGGDFLLMHHRDLYDMLYRLAMRAGAEIVHDANVVNIIPGSQEPDGIDDSLIDEFIPPSVNYGPCVVVANGDLFYADIVVGADGTNSLVRNVVFPAELDQDGYTGMNLFGTTYDVAQMESDPDLQRLINDGTWDIWMGGGESVLGYPAGNRGEYSLVAYWPDHRVTKDGETADAPDWASPYPTQKLAELLQMDNCNPTLQKLIHLPSRISKTRYLDIPNAEQWVHSSGTVVIMGEAAHPALPCSNQSVAVVVEDAAVFGALFSRLRSRDQIPSLMEAFQDLRKDRSEFLTAQEMGGARIVWLEPGPDRDTRNEGLKRNMSRGLEEWDDEGMLQDQWDAVRESFCYNATDEAADWWAGWGMLGEMAKQRARDPMEISFSVVPVVVQSTSATA